MPGYEFNYEVMEWIMHYFNEKYNFQKSNKSAAQFNGKTLINPYAMKVGNGDNRASRTTLIPYLSLYFAQI